MTPEQIEAQKRRLQWMMSGESVPPPSSSKLTLVEEIALCDLALKGLQAEARNSPKCEDCGFRMARGDSDRSGQEWWCPVCANAGIRLAENKRLRAEAEAMREAIRRADKKLSKIMRLSVFDTCEKAAVIAHEARADLEGVLKEKEGKT